MPGKGWYIKLRVGDFFGSAACSGMTGEQQALYLLMISRLAQRGELGLPNTTVTLARHLGYKPRTLRRLLSDVRKEFYERDGALFHLVVDKELREVDARSNRGKARALERWEKDRKRKKSLSDDVSDSSCDSNATAMQARTHTLTMAMDASSSSLSSPDEEKKNARPTPDHREYVDTEREALELLVIRRQANPAEPESTALATLRARLEAGWSFEQLRTALERHALEAKPEALRGFHTKVKNFLGDDVKMAALLREGWTAPATKETDPDDGPRMTPEDVVSELLRKHRHERSKPVRETD